ncbi:MAG: serine hydrolase [Bacteroides sp.]|nr:serine hydrolase [Bacteroides sp.]MCM1549348.1 serine hydrolase [Clostridium sp.]
MKHPGIRFCCIFFILMLMLSGCSSKEEAPVTDAYFRIEDQWEFQASVSVPPTVVSSYSNQYAVFPAEEHVNSSAATQLCINNSTNELIFSENAFERIYPASITKIMTALLVLERGNLNDTVTVTEPVVLNDPMAVSLELQVGDTITVDELMHGMIITSANDYAVMLGRYIAGSDSAFVDVMNQRAVELGATHTHFVNPNGLHAEEHYTTAYDLYLIFQTLIQHEEFRAIAEIPQYTIHYTDGEGNEKEAAIGNSNLFISQSVPAPEGITVIAGKTGTTNEAGSCLILEARDSQNQDYIVLVCGASSRTALYANMQELLRRISEKE